jgi:hypothetical protein
MYIIHRRAAIVRTIEVLQFNYLGYKIQTYVRKNDVREYNYISIIVLQGSLLRFFTFIL